MDDMRDWAAVARAEARAHADLGVTSGEVLAYLADHDAHVALWSLGGPETRPARQAGLYRFRRALEAEGFGVLADVECPPWRALVINAAIDRSMRVVELMDRAAEGE